jgi:hypothetical protein
MFDRVLHDLTDLELQFNEPIDAAEAAAQLQREAEHPEPEPSPERPSGPQNRTSPPNATTTHREPAPGYEFREWSYPTFRDGHNWQHTIDRNKDIINTMNGRHPDETKTPTQLLTAAFGAFDDKLESDIALLRHWVRYVFPAQWPNKERWEADRPRLENQLLQVQTMLLYFQWRITPELCTQEYVLRHTALKIFLRFAYVSFAPVLQRFMWDPAPCVLSDPELQKFQKFHLVKFYRLVGVTEMEIGAEIFYRHSEWDAMVTTVTQRPGERLRVSIGTAD